jgi:hypothetical protein
VECESKSDTANNRGDWNHLKIRQNIPGKHNMKKLGGELDSAHILRKVQTKYKKTATLQH